MMQPHLTFIEVCLSLCIATKRRETCLVTGVFWDLVRGTGHDAVVVLRIAQTEPVELHAEQEEQYIHLRNLLM